MIEEAFHEICNEAKPAVGKYVCLYIHTRPYGGSEEGGWWRDHYSLVSYQHFPTEELAEEAKVRVQVLAARLTTEARVAHGVRCGEETDWLDARGLDDSFLPEVDGYDDYRVLLEDHPGDSESHDMSPWE